MNSHKQDLFLFTDHLRQSLLLLLQVLSQLSQVNICIGTTGLTHHLLLLKSVDSSGIPVQLVLNYHDTSVSNFVGQEDRVVVCEVGVGVEDVQQVLRDVKVLLVVPQGSRQSSNQGF
jgi:hypothetical protein